MSNNRGTDSIIRQAMKDLNTNEASSTHSKTPYLSPIDVDDEFGPYSPYNLPPAMDTDAEYMKRLNEGTESFRKYMDMYGDDPEKRRLGELAYQIFLNNLNKSPQPPETPISQLKRSLARTIPQRAQLTPATKSDVEIYDTNFNRSKPLIKRPGVKRAALYQEPYSGPPKDNPPPLMQFSWDEAKGENFPLVNPDFQGYACSMGDDDACFNMQPMHEFSLNKYIETKPRSSFPKSINAEIKLLSVSLDQPARPVGSADYRVQQFPGDVDLMEVIHDCCNPQEVLHRFIMGVKKAVRKIKDARLHYYSEIKAGVDQRYNVEIGELSRGVYTPGQNLVKELEVLHNNKLLGASDYTMLMDILNGAKSSDDYDLIDYVLRKYYILRWTQEEFLAGKKKVLGKVISLEDLSIYTDTIFKVDEITLIQGRFSEVTNVLMLDIKAHDGKPVQHILGSDPNDDLVDRLKSDIEQLYYSNMYYSPFKVLKRMFSVAQIRIRQNNETLLYNSQQWGQLLEKLLPFISSPTSQLYQMKSELEAIELVLELGAFPKANINRQIDEMKFRIPNVISISNDDLITMNGIIDKITREDSYSEFKIKHIKTLITMMKKIINANTITYMNSVNLNPPPAFTMPVKAKYNRTKVRFPSSLPINPLELYKHGLPRGAGLGEDDAKTALASMILANYQ